MAKSAKPRRKAEEIRASLITAALNLFAARGYDGVSVRDIAAKAGVQASVVIRYFGSKEALFAQVLTSAQPEQFAPDIIPRLPRILAEVLVDPPTTEGRRLRSQVHRIAVRSLGSDEARALIAHDLNERYIRALTPVLSGPGAEARAGLVVSIVLGVRMLREIIKAPALDDSHRDDLLVGVEAMLASVLIPPQT